MSPGTGYTEPSASTAEKLTAEEALVARLEVEQAVLDTQFDQRRRDLAYRHELAWVQRQLFHARANVEALTSRPERTRNLYHPQPPNPATLQEVSIAHIDAVNVVLVTRGTNRRGTPRVELTSKYARYGAASKLTAIEAREFGYGLLDGAARLAAEPPLPQPGTTGPQADALAYVADVAWADLIEKGADNRGKRRIALKLKGCRYPISLGADEARTIGEGLIEAAELFEANV